MTREAPAGTRLCAGALTHSGDFVKRGQWSLIVRVTFGHMVIRGLSNYQNVMITHNRIKTISREEIPS